MHLRELREERGFSQKELATKLGVSPTNIYNYEVGRTEPSIDMLIKLAQVFDVSVDYLIGATDDVNVSASAPVTTMLSSDERNLLKWFAGMNDVQKETLLELAKSLYNKNVAQLMKRA